MTTLARAARPALVACILSAAACQKHKFEPPDREQQISQAEAQYALASFDSIQWESDSARSINGNIVYATTCRRCHGSLGEGGTEYARARDLDVPSLIGTDWKYDDDLEAVRHQIFVGHATGMPTLGVASLTLREIDAVAWFTLHVLRPDALGQSPR